MIEVVTQSGYQQRNDFKVVEITTHVSTLYNTAQRTEWDKNVTPFWYLRVSAIVRGIIPNLIILAILVYSRIIFTAPCYSNGAVMPSYGVRLSVRLAVSLSVTLVSADQSHTLS